ncbi:MAG: tRNA 4-thiouridine(8) synthase ThiI [Deltaproteobacteria bacterium]|nr:tRNA 4-thiouridine(8) synthase ThiI [Deltaproteobacteria bacterium]
MADSPAPQLALLRYSGEIGTKARATRSQFVQRLVANLRDALLSEGLEPRIRDTHNRIFVELPDAASAAVLTRVFGIQSISLVERRAADSIERLVDAGEELFAGRVTGKRFAVRARRVGERSKIALRPPDIERELGARLLEHSAGVDLNDPEVTVSIELIGDDAYFFPERIACCGGLPLGASGRAIALMSGGFDSAVAAWQLLKRGVRIDYAFCNLGGETHQLGVLRVAKVLADRWSYGDQPRLHAIDFGALTEELRARTQTRYWQILLKRAMVRAAELLVRERRASAIITGEAVGQVSSQTLPNLAVISRAATATILRPLVGANKDEIIDTARLIGTYDLSKIVGEYCAIVPTRPATAAALEAVEAEEAKIDLSIVDAAVAARSVFKLRELDVEALGIPNLEVDRIPAGATVIDLRTKPEYQSWHWPDALLLDFGRALKTYASFDRNQTYVLYCEIGLKSAHLAEFMRKEGLRAFHVPGGLKTLKKMAARDAAD